MSSRLPESCLVATERCLRRSVSVVWLILASTTVCVAQDSRAKVESEPFPQSAKIARDRQVDAIVEAARVQIAKREYAAAIAALQGLLDTPNVFVVTGPQGRSVVFEVHRLLAELPPAGRELYERLHGAQADRLWREVLRRQRSRVAMFATTPDDPSLN